MLPGPARPVPLARGAPGPRPVACYTRPVEGCRHADVIDGQCQACGACTHEVILNGACYFCGATDVKATVKPTDPVVPAARLVRGPRGRAP